MQLDKVILEKVATLGSQKVVSAFTKISGCEATVTVSNVHVVSMNEAMNSIKPDGGYSIVVYAQLLSGINGASFLIVPRESALVLVDVLNKQPVGTTGILKDFDRSTLKEILNILSNSYMSSLSETMNLNIGLGVPNMITADRLQTDISQLISLSKDSTDKAIVFETVTTISKFRITTHIYIIFSESVKDLIK